MKNKSVLKKVVVGSNMALGAPDSDANYVPPKTPPQRVNFGNVRCIWGNFLKYFLPFHSKTYVVPAFGTVAFDKPNVSNP